LVNPEKTDNIVEKISQYIENQNLYQQHCSRARVLAETKYNWKNIEKKFVAFVIQ
jgi:glycosyltransferase involved in cell wall biosynthesis